MSSNSNSQKNVSDSDSETSTVSTLSNISKDSDSLSSVENTKNPKETQKNVNKTIKKADKPTTKEKQEKKNLSTMEILIIVLQSVISFYLFVSQMVGVYNLQYALKVSMKSRGFSVSEQMHLYGDDGKIKTWYFTFCLFNSIPVLSLGIYPFYKFSQFMKKYDQSNQTNQANGKNMNDMQLNIQVPETTITDSSDGQYRSNTNE